MKNIFIPCVPHVAKSYSRSVDISEICYGYSKRTIITATYFWCGSTVHKIPEKLN